MRKPAAKPNPFAHAAVAAEHDDEGTAEFETLNAIGSEIPPAFDLPGVAPPRMTGHTGEAYTYGQRKGPTTPTTRELEVARDRVPAEDVEGNELMGTAATAMDDGDFAAATGMDMEDDGIGDATRGHPKYGATDDDAGDMAILDDEYGDETDPSDARSTVAAAGIKGANATAVTAMDDGDALATFEAAMASEEEGEIDADLPAAAQPADRDPAVAMTSHAAGTSRGKIASPPTQGQEVLFAPRGA